MNEEFQTEIEYSGNPGSRVRIAIMFGKKLIKDASEDQAFEFICECIDDLCISDYCIKFDADIKIMYDTSKNVPVRLLCTLDREDNKEITVAVQEVLSRTFFKNGIHYIWREKRNLRQYS